MFTVSIVNVDEVLAEAKALWKRIEDGIADKTITWESMPVPHPGGRAFIGKGEDMVVTVVDFDIADQGFPAGSRGYDGTAFASAGLITRLPRDVSEKFFKVALQSVATT